MPSPITITLGDTECVRTAEGNLCLRRNTLLHIPLAIAGLITLGSLLQIVVRLLTNSLNWQSILILAAGTVIGGGSIFQVWKRLQAPIVYFDVAERCLTVGQQTIPFTQIAHFNLIVPANPTLVRMTTTLQVVLTNAATLPLINFLSNYQALAVRLDRAQKLAQLITQTTGLAVELK